MHKIEICRSIKFGEREPSTFWKLLSLENRKHLNDYAATNIFSQLRKTGASIVQRAHQVHVADRDQRDHEDYQVIQDQMDKLVHQDHKDHPDRKGPMAREVNKDLQANQANQENSMK